MSRQYMGASADDYARYRNVYASDDPRYQDYYDVLSASWTAHDKEMNPDNYPDPNAVPGAPSDETLGTPTGTGIGGEGGGFPSPDPGGGGLAPASGPTVNPTPGMDPTVGSSGPNVGGGGLAQPVGSAPPPGGNIGTGGTGGGTMGGGGSGGGAGGGGGGAAPSTGGQGGAPMPSATSSSITSGPASQSEAGISTTTTEFDKVLTGESQSGPAFEGLKGDVAGALSQKLLDFLNDPSSFYDESGANQRDQRMTEMYGNIARQKGLTGGTAASMAGEGLQRARAAEAPLQNQFFTNMMGQTGSFGGFGGGQSSSSQWSLPTTQQTTQQQGTVTGGVNIPQVNQQPPLNRFI